MTTARKGIFIIACALSLSACGDEKQDTLTFWTAPVDPEVEQYAFERCLHSATGPSETTYNDWDEAIVECRRHASHVATYCPAGKDCLPSIPSRNDVRAVLTSKTTGCKQ